MPILTATTIVLGLALCLGAPSGAVATDAPAVAEISQAPRIGLWSAWLTNGLRVHAKTLPSAAEPAFAVVVTITGGELLEPPGRRGLADVAAAAWSLPRDPEPRRAEVIRRYLESQVRFRAIAQSDCLQLVLSGPESDLGLALELARVLVEQPGFDSAAFDARLATIREMTTEAPSDPDRLAVDCIRPLSLPGSMAAARAINLADLATLDAPSARDWLSGAVMQGSIEVGIASRVAAADAIELAAGAVGAMTTRPRIGSDTLAEFRDAPAPRAPAGAEVVRVPCAPPCDGTRAVLAFLGPHRSDIGARRALALGAFIIDDRVEIAMAGPGAALGPPEEARVRTFPVNPAARSSRSMIAVVVSGQSDAGADRLVSLRADMDAVEGIITDLATLGPLPTELEEAKARVAEILQAQDLSADAWATKLGTLTYDGVTPAALASAIDTYQALTAEDVRRTLGAWWGAAAEGPDAPGPPARILILPR